MALISEDAGDAAGRYCLASNVPCACMAMRAAARSLHDHSGNPHRQSVSAICIRTVDAISSGQSIRRMKTTIAARMSGLSDGFYIAIPSVQKARKVGHGARQTGCWH